MGNMSQALGRGLMQLGQELGKHAARQEEEKRYEEKLAMDKQKLASDMEESSLRQDRLKLQNDIQKTLVNTQKIRNTFITSQGDPGATSKAISQFGSGYQNRHNVTRSEEESAKAGSPRVVIEAGTLQTDKDNDPVPGKDGKPIFQKLDGTAGETVYTVPEYNDYVSRVLNADTALAWTSKNFSQEQLRQKNAELVQSRVNQAKAMETQTETGKANVRTAKAKATTAEREAKGIGGKEPIKVIGVDGKEVTRSRQEYDADTAAMKIIAKDNPEWGVTSPDQVVRINQVKNDPKKRAALADDIEKAAKNPGYAEKILTEGVEKTGLPKEMLRSMIEKAQRNMEQFEEAEKKSKGSWLKRLFFSDKPAPKGYEAGGLE